MLRFPQIVHCCLDDANIHREGKNVFKKERKQRFLKVRAEIWIKIGFGHFQVGFGFGAWSELRFGIRYFGVLSGSCWETSGGEHMHMGSLE